MLNLLSMFDTAVMDERNREYYYARVQRAHLNLQRLTKTRTLTDHAEFRAKRALGSKDPYKIISAEHSTLSSLNDDAGDMLNKLEDGHADSKECALAVPLYEEIYRAHLMLGSILYSLNISRDQLREDYRAGLLYHQTE